MGTCFSKTERSDAVGMAGLHTELAMLSRETCRLAPEFCTTPPSDTHSVALTITPTLDLNPAYSNCSKTLALVLRYLRYNVYALLFYLALVKHRVDFDGDDRKSMTMLAPTLVDGSPFKDMSTAELLEEIRKGLGLLLTGLGERKCELEEELRYVKKRKRFWSATSSVLSVALVVINFMALVAATVPTATIPTVPLVSFVGVNLLGASMKTVDPWLGMTADERKSKLESQVDAIKTMRRGSSSALLLPSLEQINALVENLKIERIALRAAKIKQNTTATDQDQADQHDISQMAAAAHLERDVEKKKKKVKKGMKSVRKMVDRVEGDTKKEAADFVKVITK